MVTGGRAWPGRFVAIRAAQHTTPALIEQQYSHERAVLQYINTLGC